MNSKIIAIIIDFLRNIKQFPIKIQNTIINGMGSYEDNYLKKRPQNLCKMCGRCCRVVTNTDYTYQQLQNIAAEGDSAAKDFIKIFEPYPSIEAAKKVDAEVVDNIIKRLKASNKYDENTLTFYKCKYILPNNMCSIYEERPKLCIYCPSSGWVVTPPGCGFNAWLFLKREEDKQKVRKAKEELLDLKVMKSKTKDLSIIQKIESVEKKIISIIDLYSNLGSHQW